MRKCGHRDQIAAGLIAGALLALACTTCIAALAGVRVNTSYSLPLGFYIRTTDAAARLIEFCPAPPFARESSERGYRTRGTACADGGVPLLKPVVALPGDLVALAADGMRVNGRLLPKTAPLLRDGAGRILRPWPFGSYVVEQGTVWVASTYDRGSYDSRYMGPIRIAQIRARLRPLWLL